MERRFLYLPITKFECEATYSTLSPILIVIGVLRHFMVSLSTCSFAVFFSFISLFIGIHVCPVFLPLSATVPVALSPFIRIKDRKHKEPYSSCHGAGCRGSLSPKGWRICKSRVSRFRTMKTTTSSSNSPQRRPTHLLRPRPSTKSRRQTW